MIETAGEGGVPARHLGVFFVKIKQQKKIRAFLMEEFVDERGAQLSGKQETRLADLIGKIENKSENQKKTLVQTLLPRIALYAVLA